MRRVEDYGPFDPVYVFVGDDGEQVMIDSAALFEWTQTVELEAFACPVDWRVGPQLLAEGAIQPERIWEMLENRAGFLDPVIFLKTGTKTAGSPDVLLCDGHHRYFMAVVAGDLFIDGYVLEPEQWEPYRIHGAPPVTQEQVRQMRPRAPRKDK